MTGELAALATSGFFTITSVLFTLAGRRIGSLVLNRIRLLLALAFLLLAHLLLGVPLPTQADGTRWLWLSISGIIGLVIGDMFLFQAFLWIGPRLTMLMMSLAPVLATALAWLLMGEQLSGLQGLGILITLGGIAWVVLERGGQPDPEQGSPRRYGWGLLFGLGAAAGQALGLLTARLGSTGDFPALSGTLIRMLAAAAALWAVTLASGQGPATIQKVLAQPRAGGLVLAGAFFGPFLGVTMSLVAIQNAPLGVASTLMALPPVFLLPVGRFLFKEQIGWRAVLGTAAAMIGVGLLFSA